MDISINCDFQDKGRLSKELKDQTITGIFSESTQNYFLRTDDLTFNKVVSKAIAGEAYQYK